MDSSINSVVGQSMVMQQAQTAQQAQMQLFKAALDNQKDQVSELMASSSPKQPPSSDSPVGSFIDTYA